MHANGSEEESAMAEPEPAGSDVSAGTYDPGPRGIRGA